MAAMTAVTNLRNEMFKKVCAVIPGKIDNSTVLKAFEVMRREQKLLKQDFAKNLSVNKAQMEKHLKSISQSKGYVEDQNNYTDMAYGESTMQYSGCEIFAAYNAIFNVTGKNPVSLPDMIAAFEKDGMVLAGKFGTAPKAVADFLTGQGFKTTITTLEKDFDELGRKSASLILTMYNDGSDISQEVHTVNISKSGGKYTAHNVYCNGQSVGPYNSVSEVISHINGGKAKGISLIGIESKAH